MIIKRTSAKDELTKVVESELKDLYRYAFYRIGDREDAEDIIQDLYIALHGRIEKIGVSCNLRNYIYRALSNN